MELVALRDLEEDEEVFLDYGDEWEAAWQRHVRLWDLSPQDDMHQSAAELNQKTKVYPTIFEELVHRTIPVNIEVQCDSAFRSFPTDCAKHRVNGTLDTFLQDTEASWWTCDILRRSPDDQLYAVYMYDRGEQKHFVVENVTASGLHYVDRPYTSSTFMPQAFRHDIRIPDEIFPDAWKNRRTNESVCGTFRRLTTTVRSYSTLFERGLSMICPAF